MGASQKRLERAKRAALELTTDTNRRWLSAQIQSYGGDSYLSKLHILEGTPPRAYIVENAERNICTVLDGEGQLYEIGRAHV